MENGKTADPAAVGPYEMFREYNGLLFISGQVSCDPVTGQSIYGSITEQTKLCLQNLRTVLEGAGSGMEKVLKCNVHMVDLSDFDEMNREYQRHFTPPYPARITFGVTKLYDGLAIEIDAVAHR